MSEMSKKDGKLAELLMNTGLPRNIAKTLAYIRNKDEVTSVEVEKATDLRQPEVSIAMQWLRSKGWLTKRDIKKEGKGRPVHGYRLTIPFSDIIKEIENQERKKIDKIEINLKEIKKLINS